MCRLNKKKSKNFNISKTATLQPTCSAVFGLGGGYKPCYYCFLTLFKIFSSDVEVGRSTARSETVKEPRHLQAKLGDPAEFQNAGFPALRSENDSKLEVWSIAMHQQKVGGVPCLA